MLHRVSQAHPLRAVLGAGTLTEEGRGDMSSLRMAKAAGQWDAGGDVNARGSRGSYSTNSVGLDREASHLSLGDGETYFQLWLFMG